MAVNVMKACQYAMFAGRKMTHKDIIENPNTKRNYISCENGRLLDENENLIYDTKVYINRNMKSGWVEYEEEQEELENE